MSHPAPGHSYSDRHNQESDSEYRARSQGLDHVKQLNLSTTKKHKASIAKMLGKRTKAKADALKKKMK